MIMSNSLDNKPSPYAFFSPEKGVTIRHGLWPCGHEKIAGTVVLLTGRREFMEKYAETTTELGQRGFDVFSMDWRGQGLSQRLLPNPHKGHINDYRHYLNDLTYFIDHLVKPRAVHPVIVLAHSMGAHIALRYLHEDTLFVDRAILTSPMIDILSPVFSRATLSRLIGMANKIGLAQIYAAGNGNYRPSGQKFEANRLTSDLQRYRREQQLIRENPGLALGGVTYGWLEATFKSIDILMQPGFASEIKTPMLVLSAEKEQIVSNKAQELICTRIPGCRFTSIPGSRHEILNESDAIREVFWREFDRFTKVRMRSEK